VKNPARENMHFSKKKINKIPFNKLVTSFAKKSNDLKPLSIPDISVLALSYELVKENKHLELIRKEPKINIVENAKVVKREKKAKKEKEEKEENTEINKFSKDEETKITTLNVDDFPDLTQNSERKIF
jgi:hypothetical protein